MAATAAATIRNPFRMSRHSTKTSPAKAKKSTMTKKRMGKAKHTTRNNKARAGVVIQQLPRRSTRHRKQTEFLADEHECTQTKASGKASSKPTATTVANKKPMRVKQPQPDAEPSHLHEHRDANDMFGPDEYEVLWHNASSQYYDANLRKHHRCHLRFIRLQLLQRIDDDGDEKKRFVLWKKVGFVGSETCARMIPRFFQRKLDATCSFREEYKLFTGNAFDSVKQFKEGQGLGYQPSHLWACDW